jgi:hypothetical protein
LRCFSSFARCAGSTRGICGGSTDARSWKFTSCPLIDRLLAVGQPHQHVAADNFAFERWPAQSCERLAAPDTLEIASGTIPECWYLPVHQF